MQQSKGGAINYKPTESKISNARFLVYIISISGSYQLKNKRTAKSHKHTCRGVHTQCAAEYIDDQAQKKCNQQKKWLWDIERQPQYEKYIQIGISKATELNIVQDQNLYQYQQDKLKRIFDYFIYHPLELNFPVQ